jgi:hypothetical protein
VIAVADVPTVYPREAVLKVEQLAAALGVSVRTAERMDLPSFIVGARSRRYLWGAVLDVLAERSR